MFFKSSLNSEDNKVKLSFKSESDNKHNSRNYRFKPNSTIQVLAMLQVQRYVATDP